MRTFSTPSYSSARQKRCPPLPAITLPDVAYHPDQLLVWLKDTGNYSRVLNTIEFQAQMRHYLHEMLMEIAPQYSVQNDFREARRKVVAQMMDWQLKEKFPLLTDLGYVKYCRHGGPDEPGCRFVFQPNSGSKGRALSSVMRGYVKESRVSSIHGNRINALGRHVEEWSKIKQAKKSGVLFIERHSGWDGFRKTQRQNPLVRLDRVVDGTLHVIVSARKKTLLAHPPVIKALEEFLPAKVIFRSPDRLGREYYQSTAHLLLDMGIEVEFEDYADPNGHCRPWRSEIQRNNSKLDRFVMLHKSKLRGLAKKVASEAAWIGDYCFMQMPDLRQLGMRFGSVARLNLKRFSNGLVELARIILNGDRRTYLINAPP